MDRVYIVKRLDDAGDSIRGVFSTAERAQWYITGLAPRNQLWLHIEEYPLDAGCEEYSE